MSVRADQAHGGAQKVYFACFTEPAEDTTTKDLGPLLPSHKQWVAECEQQGLLFVAGPFLTEDHVYSGTGLIVFRTSSAAEAARLAAADPMHSSGLRTFRIVPWQINEGALTVRMTLSDGRYDVD